MAQEGSFDAPYMFKKSGVTVVLRHSLDKYLRHKPGNKELADGDGGVGKLARWKVSTREEGGVLEASFQNENSDMYLRIHENKVDTAGKGGKYCWFRVHKQNIGIVKLESSVHEGQYVAVDKDGVRVGKGGPWCRFHILREGQAPTFWKPYLFGHKKTVVIEHRDQDHMRVTGGDSDELNSEGGKGDLAQFEAIPSDDGKKVQLKSLKSGKYVRIKDGKVDCGGVGGPWTYFKVHTVDAPNHVMLESDKHHGEFIMLAPMKKEFKVGDGKNKRCMFTFYREN